LCFSEIEKVYFHVAVLTYNITVRPKIKRRKCEIFLQSENTLFLIEQEVNQSKKRKKDEIIYNIFDIDSPYSLMSVTINTEIKESSIFLYLN